MSWTIFERIFSVLHILYRTIIQYKCKLLKFSFKTCICVNKLLLGTLYDLCRDDVFRLYQNYDLRSIVWSPSLFVKRSYTLARRFRFIVCTTNEPPSRNIDRSRLFTIYFSLLNFACLFSWLTAGSLKSTSSIHPIKCNAIDGYVEFSY